MKRGTARGCAAVAALALAAFACSRTPGAPPASEAADVGWLQHGRTPDEQRYSPLARIDGIRIAARRPYKSSAGLFTPSVPRLSTCV